MNRDALRTGTEGVYRVLRHLGMVDDPRGRSPPASTRYYFSHRPDEYVCTPVAGLFEPCRSLGEQVQAGDAAGWVHSMEEPERAAVELAFGARGTILSRRVPAQVKRGNFVFHAVEEVERSRLPA